MCRKYGGSATIDEKNEGPIIPRRNVNDDVIDLFLDESVTCPVEDPLLLPLAPFVAVEDDDADPDTVDDDVDDVGLTNLSSTLLSGCR